ncbi:MAG: hypothetical protein GIW99_11920 [Candidatus Eremiobacteraeota bacterium]|nr:hypothetical protein [Candidatus Eremiobacteraeota bacterium]MBC5828367.1 hypothetical protein [Candidatus Eremiobacteraeota bacterium]
MKQPDDGDLDSMEARDRALLLLQPLSRRKLGPGILVLLWLLRIYVIIAVPLAAYAFIRSLHQGP